MMTDLKLTLRTCHNCKCILHQQHWIRHRWLSATVLISMLSVHSSWSQLAWYKITRLYNGHHTQRKHSNCQKFYINPRNLPMMKCELMKLLHIRCLSTRLSICLINERGKINVALNSGEVLNYIQRQSVITWPALRRLIRVIHLREFHLTMVSARRLHCNGFEI